MDRDFLTIDGMGKREVMMLVMCFFFRLFWSPFGGPQKILGCLLIRKLEVVSSWINILQGKNMFINCPVKKNGIPVGSCYDRHPIVTHSCVHHIPKM